MNEFNLQTSEEIESFRVFHIANELFAEKPWHQVILGQRITPEQYQLIINVMDVADLDRFLALIRSNVDRKRQKLPSDKTYTEPYCEATA